MKQAASGCLSALFWLSLMIGTGYYFVVYQKSEKQAKVESRMAPFNEAVPGYLLQHRTSNKPISLKKKFIIIDEKTNKIVPFEEYGNRVSPLYVPKTPDEVELVVLQNCQYEQVGTYSGGIQALQEECSVKVIDVKTHTWIDRGTVKGSEPSAEIKRKRGSTSPEKGSRAMYQFFNRELSTVNPPNYD